MEVGTLVEKVGMGYCKLTKGGLQTEVALVLELSVTCHRAKIDLATRYPLGTPEVGRGYLRSTP